MEKVCIICGEMFETDSNRQKICNSIECKKENQRRESMRRRGKIDRKKYNNRQKIVDLTVEARAHGMTYGQYVAQLYLKGEKYRCIFG